MKKWVGSSEVPAAFALFPSGISRPPREWAERFFNVRRWTEMPRGGHFAALEEPELLAEDILTWFRPFRAGQTAARRTMGRSIDRRFHQASNADAIAYLVHAWG